MWLYGRIDVMEINRFPNDTRNTNWKIMTVSWDDSQTPDSILYLGVFYSILFCVLFYPSAYSTEAAAAGLRVWNTAVGVMKSTPSRE